MGYENGVSIVTLVTIVEKMRDQSSAPPRSQKEGGYTSGMPEAVIDFLTLLSWIFNLRIIRNWC